MSLYHALIRTHHITSRKKVAALKQAANINHCCVLLRSGGCPGIMYVEGSEKTHVESWVGVVRKLRYKDFQLVAKPAILQDEYQSVGKQQERPLASEIRQIEVGLSEVDSVKEFGSLMEQRGVWNWWRNAMGYAG